MNHPITPSSDLVRQWNEEALSIPDPLGWSKYIATQAARWGADQELEACCRLLNGVDIVSPDGAKTYPENLFAARERMGKLRAARRPKPPSLAEEALDALNEIEDKMLGPTIEENLIRAALNRLKELEQSND